MEAIDDRTKFLVHGFIRKASKKIRKIIPLSIIELCILFLYYIDDISIKLTFIGDGAVGKTCMIISYVLGEFPGEYIPFIFDKTIYDKDDKLLCNGYQFKLDMQDTGHGDYEPIHIQNHYPQTQVLLICFSIISRSSFQRVETKWIQHRNLYMEHVPFILVGTKIDLRNDKEVLEKIGGTGITQQEGHAMAKKIGADQYLECSALERIGLDEIMEAACNLYIKSGQYSYTKSSKTKKSCILL